jgi:uncharacterized membrane-anchored protein
MTGDSHTYSKVPEVTLGFWIIKILATTLGETFGDTITMTWLKADVMVNSGYLIGSAIFFALLVVLVVASCIGRLLQPQRHSAPRWPTLLIVRSASAIPAGLCCCSVAS